MVVVAGDDTAGNDTVSDTCHSTVVSTPTDAIDIVDIDVCSSDGDVF